MTDLPTSSRCAGLLACLLVCATGCGAEPAAGCVAGSTQTCLGLGRCDGVQVCAPDGLSFGACVCPDIGDGGFPSPDGSMLTDGGTAMSSDAASFGACDGVDCGAGRCVVAGASPACECDAGYHADRLDCVLDGCPGDTCPRSVADWQLLFDAEWTRENEARCTALSLSGGAGQEHYFLAYCVDGLSSMWRATGDDAYLDAALELIRNTLDDAVLGADGFRHWPGPNMGETYPLWDSYYWRHVVSLVRVLHEHPEVRARGDYQAQYEELLEFSERHIWDKWVAGGLGNVYRSRTHMASHWARIGMELYDITGRPEYLEVFDNISNGAMVGQPSNLRSQFEPSPGTPSAFVWSSVWGAPPTTTVQDTSHAGAIVSFIVTAYEREHHWSASDVRALTATLTELIWPASMGTRYTVNVDGSGGQELPARLHEWLMLGRFDRSLQRRIEDDYTGRNVTQFHGTQALGIAALNARILLRGSAVYR